MYIVLYELEAEISSLITFFEVNVSQTQYQLNIGLYQTTANMQESDNPLIEFQGLEVKSEKNKKKQFPPIISTYKRRIALCERGKL